MAESNKRSSLDIQESANLKKAKVEKSNGRKRQLPKLTEVSMKSDRYPFESLSSNRNYRQRLTGQPSIYEPLLSEDQENNATELFEKLVNTGLISNLTAENKKLEEETKEPEIIPASFNKPETLKIKNLAEIAAVYSGKQCGECGDRLGIETADFDDHLDWHFRQNRKINDAATKTHSSRSWYECRNKSDDLKDSTAEKQQPSVPTCSDDDRLCNVCRVAFDEFFNQEKEEWHLRLAVSFEGKNYHPLCLEDRKKKVMDCLSLETKKDLEDVDIDVALLPHVSTIAEVGAVDTTQVAVKSSIDGNVELDSVVSTIPAKYSKIKLNIKRVLVARKKPDQSNKDEKIIPVDEIPVVEVTAIKRFKPSLQGKKLTVLPTVERGGELSGLCSIM